MNRREKKDKKTPVWNPLTWNVLRMQQPVNSLNRKRMNRREKKEVKSWSRTREKKTSSLGKMNPLKDGKTPVRDPLMMHQQVDPLSRTREKMTSSLGKMTPVWDPLMMHQQVDSSTSSLGKMNPLSRESGRTGNADDFNKRRKDRKTRKKKKTSVWIPLRKEMNYLSRKGQNFRQEKGMNCLEG